jgi:molybdate transport system substrate-binding protein
MTLSRFHRAALACTALALTALTMAGCGGGEPDAPAAAGDSTGQQPPSGTVTVFAAASLTESFTAIGDDFAAVNPEVTVTFNFGASSALAQQIVSGAPADVFAAASPSTMATVTDEGLAEGEPTVFARNRLEIAVPSGNPGGVTGLADFADEALTIALCAPEVPCGAATEKAFAAAGVTAAPDTLERDVKAALTKVELGEVDAALVYRTDVQAAGDAVEGIDFPEASEAINDYQIASLADAPNTAAAQAFMQFVLSTEGLAVLGDAGFDHP